MDSDGRRIMSYRLLRTLSLAAVVGVAGALSAACGGGGANNSTPAVSNAAANRTSSNAAGGAASAGAESAQIEMSDDVFKPAQLTVPVGTKVTWINRGTKAHTVVGNDKLFDSGLVDVNGQFSYTYTSPGSYPYHCAPHPKMIGLIVVK
jgi:plastocyanin